MADHLQLNPIIKHIIVKIKADGQRLAEMLTQNDPTDSRAFDEQRRLLAEFQAGMHSIDALNGLSNHEAKEGLVSVGGSLGKLPRAINMADMESAVMGITAESFDKKDDKPAVPMNLPKKAEAQA